MQHASWKALVGLAMVGVISCASVATASTTVERDEPPTPVSRDWDGGPVSLPIGREHMAYEILNTAVGLPQTQDLQALFYQRGYIRRPDLDGASGDDSMSVAVIGWEKPGSHVTEQAPMIQVISKTYFDRDLGRRVVATQTFGGVVRDSADSLLTQGGPDAPVVVVEIVPLDTPGAIVPPAAKTPSTQDMSTPYRYAYHEGPGGVGRTIKDGWVASCPFRRIVTMVAVKYALAAGAGAGFISGNIWVGAGFAVAAWSVDSWVDKATACR